MADNVTADPGSGGSTFATDEIGGIHYPINKIAVGALDSSSLIIGGDDTGSILTSRTVSPKTSFASGVGVAAGGTANLDSSQITDTKTGKLLQVRCSASVPWKAELRTLLDGVASSILAVWFWNDPRPLDIPKGAISVLGNATAGLDGFRVVATNLDVVQTADLYAFFVWDEV